jgi:hypothetical protein
VYNSGISIAENLDKLLDAKSANKAMLTNGGIDFDASHLNLVDESSGARIHFNALPDLFKQYRNIAGFVPTIKAVQPLESLNSFLNM